MIFRRLLWLAALLAAPGLRAQDFRDASLPLETRVEGLIRQLTTEEKIGLLCASQPAIERLGIPAYDWWSECLHGVARAGQATVFPKPVGTGSAWDPDLVKRIGEAIALEARAKYHAALREKGYTARYEGLTFFSPTLNLARDPRWGRTEECYSEDPLLTGLLGEAFIKGLQGDDPRYLAVAATAKHFVANNEENRRLDGSAEVDMRSLREYYLPAFRRAVEGASVASVMGAYNALNGVPCCANPFLLTDVLRGEWGLQGPVISDGSALAKIYTHHHYAPTPEEGAALALKAGCDMALRDEYRAALPVALERGLITEADIEQALRRALALRFRLGMFDPAEEVPYAAHSVEQTVECPAHRALALEAARKSVILFKNDGVLPLQKQSLRKIALIGEAFREIHYGDYSGEPIHNLTLLDAMKTAAGEGIDLAWVSDVTAPEVIGAEYYLRPEIYAHDGLIGLTGEYYANDTLGGKPFLVRHDNRIDFRTEDRRNRELQAPAAGAGLSVRWHSRLVAPRTGTYRITLEAADATANLWLGGKQVIPATGNGGTDPVCVIPLTGGEPCDLQLEARGVGPAGAVRLLWQETFPEGTPDAATLAASSDVAVIFLRDAGGAEGSDRASLAVDPRQLDLVRRVAAANPRTVVIFGCSAPLILTELSTLSPALLCPWIAGQGEAQALAEILFGAVNPSGRTPVTFFADERELPPLDDYDVSHGRTYQYFKGKVLYPFGYGLGYTTFAYKGIHLLKKRVARDGKLNVLVDMGNPGDRYGEEVIQGYVSCPQWEATGLRQRLVGFARMGLHPGTEGFRFLEIDLAELARWDEQTGRMRVYPGTYELRVGPNAADTPLRIRFTVK